MACASPLSPPSLSPSRLQPAAVRPMLTSLTPRPAIRGYPSSTTVRRPSSRVVTVAAVGDVSGEGTNYLIAGAVAIALVGTAFPVIFSRKDICPECDGGGFIRELNAKGKYDKEGSSSDCLSKLQWAWEVRAN